MVYFPLNTKNSETSSNNITTVSSNPSEVYSLGFYWPSRLQSEIIETEVKAHLGVCCRCERVGIRIPSETEPHPDNLEWHQDGGGPDGITRHMVVWATEMPTELRLSDNIFFTGKPYELIWFNNYIVWHRQPKNTRPMERWFLAIRCSGAIF